jgi:hypothetical protein
VPKLRREEAAAASVPAPWYGSFAVRSPQEKLPPHLYTNYSSPSGESRGWVQVHQGPKRGHVGLPSRVAMSLLSAARVAPLKHQHVAGLLFSGQDMQCFLGVIMKTPFINIFRSFEEKV